MRTRYPKIIVAFATFMAIGLSPGFSQFTTPMDVPDLLDAATYEIFADVENHDFGPGYTNIPTFAYNHSSSGSNTYLGPTLVWEVGRTQTMNIVNRLGTNNTTTVHWHGANIPANTDGGPHQIILPGDTFSPSFPIIEPPANLWYHPHAEDVTYTQVQMGLAGLIIIKDALDPVAPLLPSTYGVDDFPIIIQDLKITAGAIDTTQAKPRLAIVNGTIQPVLNVPPQLVRLRILDGSTRNTFLLALVTDGDTVNPTAAQMLDMKLIGSDGGYLPDSVRTIDSLCTSPGVRNDLLVDFTNLAGSTFYLVNIPSSVPSSAVGAGSNAPDNKALLKIVVGPTPIPPLGSIPPALPAIAPLPAPNKTRTINLNGRPGGNVPANERFSINDRQFEFNVIDDTVMFNSVEDWVVVNNTPVAHPFHIHLVQFFVQSVTDLNNNPLPIPVEFLGPKDDVLVLDSTKVTFRAIFDTYASPAPFDADDDTYMYHCHILTHEDGYYSPNGGTPITNRQHWGMMQQFVVWNGVVNRDFSQPLGENLTLFPNPASDEIKLNGESSKMGILRIFDLQGKLLMEKLIPPFNGTISIDVANLPRGMVAVEMTSPEGKFTKKVVIAR